MSVQNELPVNATTIDPNRALPTSAESAGRAESTVTDRKTSLSPPSLSDFGEDPQIRIGSRTLASRYFLAPLAGYTHLAFRTTIRELGGLGLATTDLVQAKGLLSGSQKSLELIHTAPTDRPLSAHQASL